MNFFRRMLLSKDKCKNKPYPLYSVHDNIPDPIPVDTLRTLFESLEPELNSKDKIKWDQKVDEALSRYSSYVNTVCGAEKWNEFYNHLKSWDKLDYNYSLNL